MDHQDIDGFYPICQHCIQSRCAIPILNRTYYNLWEMLAQNFGNETADVKHAVNQITLLYREGRICKKSKRIALERIRRLCFDMEIKIQGLRWA